MGTNQNSNQANAVTGEIIKSLKKHSKYGGIYYDVHFKLLITGNFYRSCVYMDSRNFVNWKHLLKVGNILENLQFMETKYHIVFIDTDSMPYLLRKANADIVEFRHKVTKPINVLQEGLF